jgi:hypothetical protein
VSAQGGDVPTASFLDDRIFHTCAVVAEFFDPATALPPHRLVFNAIGEADLCRPALEAAATLMARTSAPVINHPAAVLETGRVANAMRLGALPGVIAPTMARLPRALFAGPDTPAALAREGLALPLLLRSPGYHTGRHFVRVETAAELAGAAARLPGDELLAIAYLDARGHDGQARKYRVMIIDGRLYPLHLAVSRYWKVHYFTSDMADHDDHRREDEAFLADMPKAIGAKAVAALGRIADALGLDYAGIDFGLGPDGEVLLFEANATMAVNPPDPDPRWDYRRTAVTRILDAVGAMMRSRAEGPESRHHRQAPASAVVHPKLTIPGQNGRGAMGNGGSPPPRRRIMSISAISASGANAYQPQSGQSEFWQEWGNLVSALNSGSLSGAQQAYSSLNGLLSSSQSSSTTANNPLSQALSQIGQALQNNNLTGAQQALTSLQQSQGSQHHHHHGGGENSANSASTSGSSTATSSETIGISVNLTA